MKKKMMFELVLLTLAAVIAQWQCAPHAHATGLRLTFKPQDGGPRREGEEPAEIDAQVLALVAEKSENDAQVLALVAESLSREAHDVRYLAVSKKLAAVLSTAKTTLTDAERAAMSSQRKVEHLAAVKRHYGALLRDNGKHALLQMRDFLRQSELDHMAPEIVALTEIGLPDNILTDNRHIHREFTN